MIYFSTFYITALYARLSSDDLNVAVLHYIFCLRSFLSRGVTGIAFIILFAAGSKNSDS